MAVTLNFRKKCFVSFITLITMLTLMFGSITTHNKQIFLSNYLESTLCILLFILSTVWYHLKDLQICYLLQGNDHMTTTANTGQHHRVFRRPIRWALDAPSDTTASTPKIQCQLAFAFPTPTTGDRQPAHATAHTNSWSSRRPGRWRGHSKQPGSWWSHTVVPNPRLGWNATAGLRT